MLMKGSRWTCLAAIAVGAGGGDPRVGTGHRDGRRDSQGRAGRRHSRRDRHSGQRDARDQTAARRYCRQRQTSSIRTSRRHVHAPSDDDRVQDPAAQRHRREPGRPCGRADARARSRRTAGNGRSQRRVARHPGAERRAIVHRHDRAVENLPIASRSFTALAALAPGVTGTAASDGSAAAATTTS